MQGAGASATVPQTYAAVRAALCQGWPQGPALCENLSPALFMIVCMYMYMWTGEGGERERKHPMTGPGHTASVAILRYSSPYTSEVAARESSDTMYLRARHTSI